MSTGRDVSVPVYLNGRQLEMLAWVLKNEIIRKEQATTYGGNHYQHLDLARGVMGQLGDARLTQAKKLAEYQQRWARERQALSNLCTNCAEYTL